MAIKNSHLDSRFTPTWLTTTPPDLCYTLEAMATRVLLVGHGLFREGLERLLGESGGVEVVGAAETWAEAEALMRRANPQVVIADHDTSRLNPADLAPFLHAGAENMRIIYLTLADNTMIIHQQQALANATLGDLQAVLASPPGGASG